MPVIKIRYESRYYPDWINEEDLDGSFLLEGTINAKEDVDLFSTGAVLIQLGFTIIPSGTKKPCGNLRDGFKPRKIKIQFFNGSSMELICFVNSLVSIFDYVDNASRPCCGGIYEGAQRDCASSPPPPETGNPEFDQQNMACYLHDVNLNSGGDLFFNLFSPAVQVANRRLADNSSNTAFQLLFGGLANVGSLLSGAESDTSTILWGGRL